MDESVSAVVAHGLLNSLAVVHGGMATLTRAWDELTAVRRREVVEMSLSQAELMADGLDALPSEARHRLANHLFVVRGVCETLLREGEGLGLPDRDELIGVVRRQADHAASVLTSVVTGLPAGVRSALDQLNGARNDAGMTHAAG